MVLVFLLLASCLFAVFFINLLCYKSLAAPNMQQLSLAHGWLFNRTEAAGVWVLILFLPNWISNFASEDQVADNDTFIIRELEKSH